MTVDGIMSFQHRGKPMRALAFATLTAGILTTAFAPASAATFVEDFTISVFGDADQNFLSSPFALFDPKLGALLSVSESVTGPLTWNFGDSLGDTLLLAMGKTGASQFFLSSDASGSQDITVGLSGAGTFQFIGFGTSQESLAVSGPGTLSGDSLMGELTFTYTPAAAPEASTWAMMLVGFAGLGYAVVRRKQVSPRSVSA
jgi:hypothetical protein